MQQFSLLPSHMLVHCHLKILRIVPIEFGTLLARQIDDIQCNIARFKTVEALNKAQAEVKALAANIKYVLPTPTCNFIGVQTWPP
jgi:hypothetical protein